MRGILKFLRDYARWKVDNRVEKSECELCFYVESSMIRLFFFSASCLNLAAPPTNVGCMLSRCQPLQSWICFGNWWQISEGYFQSRQGELCDRRRGFLFLPVEVEAESPYFGQFWENLCNHTVTISVSNSLAPSLSIRSRMTSRSFGWTLHGASLCPKKQTFLLRLRLPRKVTMYVVITMHIVISDYEKIDLDILARICCVLDCIPEDIIEYAPRWCAETYVVDCYLSSFS